MKPYKGGVRIFGVKMGSKAERMAETPTRTIRQVVAALKAAGAPADIELIQGNGYLYFWSAECAGWSSTSVPVCRLRHIATVEGWVSEYLRMRETEGR